MLAELLGCTVAEMRRRVSGAEYLGWAVFLGRRGQQKQMAAMRGR